MNKYTPGPWDYGWEIQPNGCPTVGHKGLMVCMVAHSAKDPNQREVALANANLIAAAPDMLEALKSIIKAMLSSPTGPNMTHEFDISKAERAIAKARGYF